jgi:xanthine dehydrogenase YagS FAD-binding subunit
MQTFAYRRAASAADAILGLQQGGPGTRLLAGGTTLYDLMKLGIELPRSIVDINAIPDLRKIEFGDDELAFGALVRMNDLAEDERLRTRYPAIAESLSRAASQQLRNMASLGGNLLQRTRCAYFRGGEPFPCNKRNPGTGCAAIGGIDRGHALLGGSSACIATYPGDFAVTLVAFDAVVDVLGPTGARSIAVEQLHRLPGSTPHVETTLAEGELITRIRVPASRAGRASTYHKIRDRESYAFALASAAVALDLRRGVIEEARLALGGVGTKPWRAREAERLLHGQPPSPALALRAGQAAFADAQIGRHNGFRVQLGEQAVADAILVAAERA